MAEACILPTQFTPFALAWMALVDSTVEFHHVLLRKILFSAGQLLFLNVQIDSKAWMGGIARVSVAESMGLTGWGRRVYFGHLGLD